MDTRIIRMLVAVCAVSTVSAKVCFPDQWQTAVLGKIGQVVKGQTQVGTMSGMEYGDFKKNMYSLMVDINYDSYMVKLKVVSDYNKKQTYMIYPDKCVASPITTPLRQYCEGDDDFELVRSFSLGGQPAGMYRSNFPNMTTEATLMKKDFTPVSSVIVQDIVSPQLLARQFGNFSRKITDKGVFDIPSYCGKEEERSNENSNPPSRVCALDPYEVEGFGTIGQVASSMAMAIPISLKEFRDFKNKIEATQDEVVYGGQTIRTVTVTDWNKGKRYVMNKDLETCKVMNPPTKEMMEFCSDNPNLKLVKEFTLIGRKAAVYDTVIGNTTTTSTVFSDSFEFITSVTEQEYSGTPQMIALQFGNMTRGITDRKVFKIPSYCKE